MKNNQKYSVFAGILMFILAAFCFVSLALAAIDFGENSPAHNTIFYTAGTLITRVYGFCSLLIPLFLIVAGLQCFNSRWTARNGVLLAGSVIPFFTLDALEHLIRIFAASESGSVMWVKIGSAVLLGGMVIAAEYILLSILGDVIVNLTKKRGQEESVFGDETEDSDAFENEEKDVSEDVVIVEKEEEQIEEESEQETEEKVFEETQEIDEEEKASEEPAEEEKLNEEDVFDFSNDKLFHEQKKILKDLITADKTEEEAKKFEQEIAEEEKRFAPEPSPAEEESAEAVSDDFIEEEPAFEVEENKSPFELPDPEADFLDEPVIVEEYAFNDEDKTFIPEEEALPLNDNDFGEPVLSDEGFTEAYAEEPVEMTDEGTISFDEPAEVRDEDTISFGEPEIAEIPEITEEPVFEQIEDFNPDEFSPAPQDDYVDPAEFLDDNADKVTDTDSDEYIEIEDIFSQMDEDAAENPVMKEKRIEEPVEERSFDDPLFAQQNQDEEAASELDALSFEMDSDANGQDNDENLQIYEFDPTAKPVVDSNGNPFAEEEADDEDRSLSGIEGLDDDVSDFQDTEEVVFDEIEPEMSEEEPFEEISDVREDDSDGISAEDKAAGITKDDDPYERKKKRTIANYKISPDLLTTYENGEYWVVDAETKQSGEYLKQTLNEFGIEAEVTGIRKGPVVTMFELLPASGVRLSKIVSLQDNIALALAASSVRIVAPIPGKHAVGIEVPNKQRAVVSFKEIVSEKLPQFEKMQIPVILGKDISGEPQIIDLAKTPHLLIAGSTGAGKSVCVNSMILSILYKRSPQQVKLVLIDPKVVELKLYNDIPHLLTPVITEPKKALQALQYCLCEMERRYALLDGMGVRDIISYNKKIVERKIATEKLPYIVVIIDEFADLMATTGKELESNVARLAAMSRAVGIHLVLATQRPSVNVITGLIKANIPSRIAFMVASRQDSQIIIDGIGAEKLLGKGDMLYASATDPFPTRIQGTLVGDDEVERVVNEVKTYGEPEYIDDEIFVDEDGEESAGPGLFSDGEDPLYDQALQIVIQAGKASASYIQRRLKIGYNRAARLVEEMEERGIVGPANGSKPREVIHMP